MSELKCLSTVGLQLPEFPEFAFLKGSTQYSYTDARLHLPEFLIRQANRSTGYPHRALGLHLPDVSVFA
jgi:hypothetical protein